MRMEQNENMHFSSCSEIRTEHVWASGYVWLILNEQRPFSNTFNVNNQFTALSNAQNGTSDPTYTVYIEYTPVV